MQFAGLPLERTADEAWPDFRGWRVNYEQIAYAVARRVDAVPAPWSGPRDGAFPPIEPVRPVDRRPGGRIGNPMRRVDPEGGRPADGHPDPA